MIWQGSYQAYLDRVDPMIDEMIAPVVEAVRDGQSLEDAHAALESVHAQLAAERPAKSGSVTAFLLMERVKEALSSNASRPHRCFTYPCPVEGCDLGI